MFRKLKNLREYYDFIGCEKSYEVKMNPCEICNGQDFTVACSHTDTINNYLAPIPVQVCNSCGYLMQNPRFPKEFYERYYNEFYPLMRANSASNRIIDPKNVSGKRQMNFDGSTNAFGFNNALERAENLYKYIENLNYHISPKSILDVGCGCGGFLEFFESKGFKAIGNDPDTKTANYGLNRGLKIDIINGEAMNYKEKFGLIIIMGSLEHVLDPNIILEKCFDMLSEDGMIVIEGRYYPLSECFRWLNSNHHRFLTHHGAQSILIKNGFKIFKSTTDSVSGKGNGRNGNGYAFGIKSKTTERYLNCNNKKCREALLKKLEEHNLIIKPEFMLDLIEKHNSKFDIKYI